jgi:hypothetical protein
MLGVLAQAMTQKNTAKERGGSRLQMLRDPMGGIIPGVACPPRSISSGRRHAGSGVRFIATRRSEAPEISTPLEPSRIRMATAGTPGT